MTIPNRNLIKGLAVVLALGLGTQAPAHCAKPKARPKHAPVKPLPVLPMPVKVVVPTAPAAVPGEVLLFNGDTFKASGLTAASWGGGKVEDSTDIAYANSHSLKVTTIDFYQGARIVFDNPVALASAGDPKSTFFQMKFRFVRDGMDARLLPAGPAENSLYPISAETAKTTGSRVPSSDGVYRGGARLQVAQASGPPPGFGGAGRPTGPPPGFGGAGRPNGPPPGFGGAGAGQPAARPQPVDTFSGPPFNTFRFLFTLTNGAQADIMRAVPESDGEHWIDVAVPLAAIKFPGGLAGGSLKSVTIGGDKSGAFYIGQLKFIKDDAPITCKAGPTQDVSKGDLVTFHAEADGGASTLTYAWDFDASDGVTEQAHGQTVTTHYFKGDQDYKVTLTVSDADGIKKPVTATTTIHVEE